MTATGDGAPDPRQTALAALDRALEVRPDQVFDQLVDAVRCLVRVRDDLIERRRAGDHSRQLRERLDRVNAIVSVVVGGEYPLVGVRLERVRKARDALDRLIADTA